MSYNFTLVNCDTDSIMVAKPDGTPFSEEEQTRLLNELNGLFPEQIRWEPDGTYPVVVVLKAKNYTLYDGKKITIKGSALKDPKKSPALKEFINKMIDCLLFDKTNYQEIYHSYVKEILNVTDIKRWASRKTLSSTMQESDRTNETRILDALEGSNYVEGDRFYTFFKSENEICLVENFIGEYDKSRLLKSLYNTASIFSTVLPTKELFINYSLKTKQKLLQDIK